MQICSAKQMGMPRTNAKISQLWESLLICDSPETPHITSVLPCPIPTAGHVLPIGLGACNLGFMLKAHLNPSSL